MNKSKVSQTPSPLERVGVRLLLLFLFFASCQNDIPDAGNDSEVSLGLSVNTTEMQAAGGDTQTRSIGDAMDITFGADPATRSSKNPDETAIKSLYLVQFNGTAAGSTVVKSGSIIRNATDNTAMFDFAAVNATCRIYVVANFNPNVAVGTSLSSFERMMADYLPSTSVAATGLPMCGYVDFNPATTVNTPQVSLKAMVAKLTVTYTVEPAALIDFKPGTGLLDIKLRNVPNGTAYGVATNFTTAWRPTNVTYADVAVGTTGATYTYYVPENIAGSGSANITNWSRRSLANAPINALYFEVTGRNNTNDSTITIASFIGDPNDLKAFNVKRNYAYTLTATIKNVDMKDERITVEPDYFDLNANLGDRTANCYVITANSSTLVYFFDATKRGNNSNAATAPGIDYGGLLDLSQATEARVIWQTGGFDSVIKSVKYERDDRVHFTMGTATEGNAVIGIFASSAENAPCLWSWHIWKLNGSVPADVPSSKISATTGLDTQVYIMALNLGAYCNTQGDPRSIGLFYQWGRKDPFPGPAGFNNIELSNIYGSFNNGGTTGSWRGTYTIQTSTTNATIGTEAWAAKYPTVCIVDPSTNGDWYWGDTRNHYLWGTPWVDGGVGGFNRNQGAKSIYDPCPVGYRVPPQDTWNKQTTGIFQNDGVVLSISTGLWFPAAGIRNGGSAGELVNSPGYGYYWSSSSYGDATCGSSLDFYTYFQSVHPRYANNRAHGFSVRCVVE